MIPRILVLLDGSHQAEQAIPFAVSLARASRGSLMLLRMLPLPPLNRKQLPCQLQREFEAKRQQAAQYVTALARAPLLKDLDISTKVILGIRCLPCLFSHWPSRLHYSWLPPLLGEQGEQCGALPPGKAVKRKYFMGREIAREDFW
jgi:hypothetical protein